MGGQADGDAAPLNHFALVLGEFEVTPRFVIVIAAGRTDCDQEHRQRSEQFFHAHTFHHAPG